MPDDQLLTQERSTLIPRDPQHLRSQRIRTVNHQGDALRLGMNWTEESRAISLTCIVNARNQVSHAHMSVGRTVSEMLYVSDPKRVLSS